MFVTYMDEEDYTDKKSNRPVKSTSSQLFIESILNSSKIRGKTFLNTDCTQMKITPGDEYTADHYLILTVGEDLNVSVSSHSLPDPNGRLFNFAGTIESFAAKFFEYLDQMEEFYEHMSTIDELCFVVDPAEITTKCNSRIIKLDERVYMKIVVDPLIPSSITTTFYGPTTSVEFYRDKYREGISEWNPEVDIYRNFSRIFEIVSFPQKSIEEPQEYCSICYIYRLNNQIPMITCDNTKCYLAYHTLCLKEWFSSIRDSKTFLNVTSGQCPSCKEKLSASFVQLIDD